MSREGILRLVEGELVDIKCYANNGYPAANFVWLAPIRKNLSASLQIFECLLRESNSSNISSSSQVARYRPELSDQNKTLSCTVKQEENGRTHFTRTFVFRLEIQRRAVLAKSYGFL